MIYRRLGFLAVVWFGSSPTPSPPSPVSKLSLFLSLPLCPWPNLLTGEAWERVGEEPNHTTARKPGLLYFIKYSLGGGEQSNESPPLPPLIPSGPVDISFKDDVSVLLFLGVSILWWVLCFADGIPESVLCIAVFRIRDILVGIGCWSRS